MSLEIITDGLTFAEGPVVLAEGGVLVCETLGGRLTKVAPDGKKTLVGDTGGGPNGAAIGPDGRCWIANNGGFGPSLSPDFILPSDAPLDQPPGSIQAVDMATGAVETIYSHTPQTPFWGPNDLVFDGQGGFWFSDFGRNRERVQTRGSIYYAKADGSAIEEMVFSLDGPNGVGLSPDGNILYVAETYSGHLWQFRLSGPGQIDRSAGQSHHGGAILGRAGPGQFLEPRSHPGVFATRRCSRGDRNARFPDHQHRLWRPGPVDRLHHPGQLGPTCVDALAAAWAAAPLSAIGPCASVPPHCADPSSSSAPFCWRTRNRLPQSPPRARLLGSSGSKFASGPTPSGARRSATMAPTSRSLRSPI
jgi:gluconolactonase